MSVEIGFPEPEETTSRLQQMADAALASRIAERDATLWGEDAQETAATRLGWTDLHTRAAGLVEQVEALRAEFAADGVDRFVLAGMGGSSLGAGVIASAHGDPLTIVDTTDPHDIAALCESDDLERSALVVATKSGTTIETISAASAFAQALLSRDIDPRSRLVAVTDPGTTLAEQAVEERWRRVFLADPSVGGRFSALSAFGLVPAGLAGADVQQVVDEAAGVAAAVRTDDTDNPALQLGALLVAAHARDVRTLALAAMDPVLVTLPAWLEQLIAESTGKAGLGFLPVTCEGIEVHGFRDAHAATALVFAGPAQGDHQPISGIAVSVDAPLGAQLLIWETAVALVCAQIGVNPFDQPDVESAKQRTRALLEPDADADAEAVDTTAAVDDTEAQDQAPTDALARVEDDPLTAQLSDGIEGTTIAEVLAALLPDPQDEDQYLAVQAFLSPQHDGDVARLRNLLARKSGGTVAFGWGPQYLHSTGQFHKGGRPTGAFLFLTGEPEAAPSLEIPQAGFTFAQLQVAQAEGDAAVLRDLGRPVVTLALADRSAGIGRLLEIVETLPDAPSRLPDEAPAVDEVEPDPAESDGAEPEGTEPEGAEPEAVASDAVASEAAESGAETAEVGATDAGASQSQNTEDTATEDAVTDDPADDREAREVALDEADSGTADQTVTDDVVEAGAAEEESPTAATPAAGESEAGGPEADSHEAATHDADDRRG